MCGISGIVSFSAEKISSEVLQEMNDIISHRGPDGEGFFINSVENVGFGHRRLSVIDLSENASQPMRRGDIVITYNGEIYNYLELKEELQQLGFSFGTESDTEVILAAYQTWGKDCVQRLNGMWAFLILDETQNSVFVSRDRFGIKPLYYFEHRNKIYFSSEIKQFTVLPEWVPSLNRALAYDFLKFGATSHTNQTFFEGVLELRGGEAMTLDLAKSEIRKYRYYHPSSKNPGDEFGDRNEKIDEFRNLMTDSIRIAMRSDVKVGSALSGGIDSSVIALMASKFLAQENKAELQECVSACFEDKSVDESYFVDKVARKGKIKVHKVFPEFEQMKSDLDALIWHQDEPFGTLSIYAQYCVFREAKANEITVMLDGQGADEILAGYDHFYRPFIGSQFKRSKTRFFSSLYHYFRLNKRAALDTVKAKMKKKLKSAGIVKEGYFKSSSSLLRLNIAKNISEFSYDQLVNIGMHTLLRFEDRNSMAFSIESRVPFLDHRVVDFSLSLPDEYKIYKGVRKHILREAFKNELPKEIYNRYDKYGFPTPQELWTRQNMPYFFDELKKSRELLGEELVDFEKIFDQMKDESQLSKEDIFAFWRVIIFSRWVSGFKVQLYPGSAVGTHHGQQTEVLV